MFFFFLFCFLLNFTSSQASLKDGISYFEEGNYAEARRILGHNSFKDNINAQLYHLASQGFEPQDRSDPLIAGLKTLLENALSNSRHPHHNAARLVRAFWNLYSEGAVRDAHLSPLINASRRATESVIDLQTPSTVLREADPLLQGRATHYHAVDMEFAAANFPPLGGSLDGVNAEEVARYIEKSQHFSIPHLFEGTPSEKAGLEELHELVSKRDHHALYSLGAFYLNWDESDDTLLIAEHKGKGLGCMMAAGHLQNASAIKFSRAILHLEEEAGWANNCKIWCCYGVPKESPRLGCGGDTTGRWWSCGLGLWGFMTRWPIAQLCSSIRNVTRETLENLTMLAGLGLIFLQNLDESGIVDIFEDDQAVAGWTGLLLAGGGFGAARVGK